MGATATGAAAGAGIGATASLAAGPFAPLVAPATAAIGAIIGGVAGIGGGVAAGIAAKDAAEKNNEKVRKETDELAIALAKGDILPTEEEIAKKLVGMGYAGEEARKMAVDLAKNADSLREYGEQIEASDAK